MNLHWASCRQETRTCDMFLGKGNSPSLAEYMQHAVPFASRSACFVWIRPCAGSGVARQKRASEGLKVAYTVQGCVSVSMHEALSTDLNILKCQTMNATCNLLMIWDKSQYFHRLSAQHCFPAWLPSCYNCTGMAPCFLWMKFLVLESMELNQVDPGLLGLVKPYSHPQIDRKLLTFGR